MSSTLLKLIIWYDERGTQEKKLKNWYIQEYTSGTTFEPNIFKKPVNEEVKTTMVDFNNKVLND